MHIDYCPTTGMKVLFAYYGISCASQINVSNQKRSTDWVSGLCDGKSSCTGCVSTSVLTDPYIGCGKDFIAVERCANGEVISNLVTRERLMANTFHSTVSLAADKVSTRSENRTIV